MPALKFVARKLNFGDKEPTDDFEDDGTGLPTPKMTKAYARRWAGIREAKEVLAIMPAPGESLHVVCTARMDLTDVINGIIDKQGRIDRLTITTLGYNEKNLATMLRWIDTGAVKTLNLVASLFLRAHKRRLWEETLIQFRQRGQRAAACHSHCKVVAMFMANGSAYSLEGSANLCGNGSGREQFAMFNDAELTAWHAGWIMDLLDKHEQPAETPQEPIEAMELYAKA